MKKREIHIGTVASYWGNECSWLNSWEKPERVYELLGEDNIGRWRESGFKLHLRRPLSITEAELRDLGEAIFKGDKSRFTVLIDGSEKIAKIGNSTYFRVHHHQFQIEGLGLIAMIIINYLRQKGFCVDKELIDNDLVEWKE